MNKKKNFFIVSSLLAITPITHGMKSISWCFPSFLCCCYSKKKISNTHQEKILKKNNILKNLEIKTSIIPTLDQNITKTKLSFILDDNEIGYSVYENMIYDNDTTHKKYIYLHNIFLNDDYRDCGLGKELFKKTMEDIHKSFPDIEIVEWRITPIGDFESVDSIHKARKILFIFYKKCGAIVDTKENTGYINLKNTGYFNKN